MSIVALEFNFPRKSNYIPLTPAKVYYDHHLYPISIRIRHDKRRRETTQRGYSVVDSSPFSQQRHDAGHQYVLKKCRHLYLEGFASHLGIKHELVGQELHQARV